MASLASRPAAEELLWLSSWDGAAWLYQQQGLEMPLIACVFTPERVPIVALVGWPESVNGQDLARIDRLVGNRTHPPTLADYNRVWAVWLALIEARRLTGTVAYVEKSMPRLDTLLRRYGFARYAEDDQWWWYWLAS